MEQALSPTLDLIDPRPATPKTLTRWKAAAIHLGICALIALAVFACMALLWYPQPYFEAVGGAKLALTIIGVDVVIGPLITLIVYNPKKKSLRFDLAVVALLQTGALVYGIHVVYAARPVYVVFNVDRFDVVGANELFPDDWQTLAPDELKTLPLTGPRLVAADRPSDAKEQERLLFTAVTSGVGLPNFPQYYVPYHERTAAVIAKSQPLAELREKRPESEADLTRVVKMFGQGWDDLAFLPVRARKQDLTAIIDRRNGNVVKVLPIDPWL
ncbi:MAG: TfpX/TfpZ family type IV pilin accessory protein [Gammaproteobacteria bacterium]